MATSREMTEGRALPLIFNFTLPLLLGNLLQQTYSLVDAAIVGRFLGINALASVGASTSVVFLILGFCNGCCGGFGIPVAQKFGARDYVTMRRYVAISLQLAAVMSVVIAVVTSIYCADILHMMSTPENIFTGAYYYLLVTFIGVPFTFFYNLLSSIIRALGDSKTPFCFLLLSTVLNILLDLFCILVLGWGVAGAAIATLASRVFCAVVVLWQLRMDRQPIVVRNYRQIRPDGKMIRRVLALGIPSGIENSMFQLGKLAIQSSVSTLGTVAIAAQAMTNILENLNGIAAIGVGIGLMTVVGQCLGAGRKDEAVYYIKKLSVLAEIIVVASCLLVFALTIPVTKLGGMESESARMCFHMISWITVVKPIVWTLAFIPAYGLRAAGDVKFSMLTSCITMWTFRFCLCVYLIRFRGFGPMAVWIGMFTDWTVRGIVFSLRFHSRKWLKHKVV
jgi:putative MATE family efflux protein